jgi:hypothetical protein
MRNAVLDKQSMCLKHKQFQEFAPAFDDVLKGMPEWEAPAKFSLSALFLGILTLQNMGICQASLLAIFENSAVTTKLMATACMFVFPGGFILYTYITLRGVMEPEAKIPLIFTGGVGVKYWTVGKVRHLHSMPSRSFCIVVIDYPRLPASPSQLGPMRVVPHLTKTLPFRVGD